MIVNDDSTDDSTASAATGRHPRYRCTTCGNLTRFDVVATRRTKAFHHYSVGGDLTVKQSELLSEDIESVSCRWCSSPAGVVTVEANDG